MNIQRQICERCCCFGFVYNIKFEKENERNARCMKKPSCIYLYVYVYRTQEDDDEEEEKYMIFF